MDQDNSHLNWEKDAPHIAAAGRQNPFLVPEGYFDTMQQHLSARIAVESLGKDPGFNVPDGYFDKLPALVEAKIAVEELKAELSAEGFKVPPGYFDTLSRKISDRTVSEKKSVKRKLLPVWINYAAAACITVIIGLTVFININRNSINGRLSRVPDHAIENYLELYSDQTDVQVIEENIKTTDAFSGITNTISEKDLEEYIEETTL